MGRGKLRKVVYRRHVSETGEQSAKCAEGKGREDGRRTRRKEKGCVDLDKERGKGETSSVVDSLRFIFASESVPCPPVQCLSE